jgi:hypothetical protein
MGNNKSYIPKEKLYDGYSEGVYSNTREPYLKAYKKLKCKKKINNNSQNETEWDDVCIAHLILTKHVYKKLGNIYPPPYDYDEPCVPCYELITNGGVYVTRIVDSNGAILDDSIICRDEEGNIFFNDSYIEKETVKCYSKY